MFDGGRLEFVMQAFRDSPKISYRLGLVNTLVTHADTKGLGLTPLSGDHPKLLIYYFLKLVRFSNSKNNDQKPIVNLNFAENEHFKLWPDQSHKNLSN